MGRDGAIGTAARRRDRRRTEGGGIRILFINPGLDLGGAEQSLLLLLTALRDRNVETKVLVFGHGPFEERLSQCHVPVDLLQLSNGVRRGTRYSSSTAQTTAMLLQGLPGAMRLASRIRRENADIVHTNGAKAHLLGGFAARLAGKRVVCHVRDFPPTGAAGRLFGFALRAFPDKVIANSGAVARSLEGVGVPADRVVVVDNPIDLQTFVPHESTADPRRRLGLPCERPLVGMVAHLTPWKGHARFLQIAQQVRSAVPDASFVIAGGSIYETNGHAGYLEELNRQTAALGLTEHVSFLGKREDISTVMAALDVLVHCPSQPEPFGRVLAEAMSARRPVVAARAGGIPEVVDDAVTGFLVDADDVAQYAARVQQLLRDPALRRAMGSAGRTSAEARFSVNGHADRVQQVYRGLTTARRADA